MRAAEEELKAYENLRKECKARRGKSGKCKTQAVQTTPKPWPLHMVPPDKVVPPRPPPEPRAPSRQKPKAKYKQSGWFSTTCSKIFGPSESSSKKKLTSKQSKGVVTPKRGSDPWSSYSGIQPDQPCVCGASYYR